MTQDSRGSNVPTPHTTLHDEGGATTSWLAADWSQEDIAEEYDIDPSALSEVWFGCRFTTEEERADPDLLYDLFGCDPEDIDPTVCYWRAKPNAPGAHRYWTTEP